MKRKASWLLPFFVTSTLLAAPLPSLAADVDGYVTHAELTATQTAEPVKDDVVPSGNQYRYQKNELAGFVHFGPNTFEGIEWGEHYGRRPPADIFRLSKDFDAETLVMSMKKAGFKQIIVVAKHHDGFCLWNSAFTDYDIANTNYKNGQGDILAEISAVATRENMDMGLYLSPWDIHEPSYGYYDANHRPTTQDRDVLDYNEHYNNQLNEILSNPKYGNNGHFTEIWMDGAKGSGANAQDYNFQKWFDTIQRNEGRAAGFDSDAMLFGAESHTTVRWIGNELGLAGANTWSKSKVNKQSNTIDSRSISDPEVGTKATVGWEDGNQWTVPEADARITAGWFWANNRKTPKSLKDLGNMYFNSVGHNAVLLLNIPPNTDGTVDEAIRSRLGEFGDAIKQSFAKNLAAASGASLSASNVRGNAQQFSPNTLVDGDDATHWSTDDGQSSGSVIVDLGRSTLADVVSVEEAIEFGQRINHYTIEYRNNTTGAWTKLKEGTTIGAKRLVRDVPFRARQVRITVSTPDNKVPVLSEVGVYKVAEPFELASPVPEGMDLISITQTPTALNGNIGFQAGRGWNAEGGVQYINGANKWAKTGATLTLKFHGSKVYLMGTRDPGHGTMDVSIDGGRAVTVDTKDTTRSVGQKIYESPDLDDGDHTLTLRVKSEAIGIEAAFVINNGGVGMVGIDRDSFRMNEASTLEVPLTRVGGTTGEVRVSLQPNPGSAIQDDFDTDNVPVVTFADGQKTATAPVKTRRNTNETGDQHFTVELTDPSDTLILGFITRARIDIADTETEVKKPLLDAIAKAQKLNKAWYTQGWEAFEKARDAAVGAAEQRPVNADAMSAAVEGLATATAALVERQSFSAEDPFVFPSTVGAKTLAEAEFGQVTDVKLPSDGRWAASVNDAAWASHGKFVNCINQQDTLTIPYRADRAGTYRVTAFYRSGDPRNALAWTEPSNKIEAGQAQAGDSSAQETRRAEFDMVVTEAGAGSLVFTGPEFKSPQLDALEFELISAVEEPSAPSDPSESEEPTQPADPGNTTEPSTPGEPANPAGPSDPAGPSGPETPTVPDTPGQTGEPSDPSGPSGSEEQLKPIEIIGLVEGATSQGKPLSFVVRGVAANSKVTYTVHSQPVVLDPVTADSLGVARAEWMVPKNFEVGEHSVVASVNGAEIARATFRVMAAPADTADPAAPVNPGASPEGDQPADGDQPTDTNKPADGDKPGDGADPANPPAPKPSEKPDNEASDPAGTPNDGGRPGGPSDEVSGMLENPFGTSGMKKPGQGAEAASGTAMKRRPVTGTHSLASTGAVAMTGFGLTATLAALGALGVRRSRRDRSSLG
ncbi:alpha-L-fucosidase [Schaalia sp. ZJ1691]|uniref:alpha-L-fucosidase n=1 Tax=Schaalia sp. ZJ1691 TaxID=2709404 RepID=UPI0013EA9D8D|nr:alpha-L-fucosidase [Schaalia sp. ZJ1691]